MDNENDVPWYAREMTDEDLTEFRAFQELLSQAAEPPAKIAKKDLH